MNILWVENNPRFVEVAGTQFLAEHCVQVVPSVAAARAALLNATFDVVLLDYDLDDGVGTQLVVSIKALADTPVLIAVSSRAIGNELLLGAGADAVCSKQNFAGIAAVIAQAAKQHARQTL